MTHYLKFGVPIGMIVSGGLLAFLLKNKGQSQDQKTARQAADEEKERIAAKVRSENARKAANARWKKGQSQNEDDQ